MWVLHLRSKLASTLAVIALAGLALAAVALAAVGRGALVWLWLRPGYAHAAAFLFGA